VVNQFKTECALEAYKEEFNYFSIEGGAGFISLCKELFIEENGKLEANEINWQWVENKLTPYEVHNEYNKG
jgi:hypothetical protein